MTPENFCYWLQGWFELNQTIDHREGATPETLQVMQDHLALVFNKVTPAREQETPSPYNDLEPVDNLDEAYEIVKQREDKRKFAPPTDQDNFIPPEERPVDPGLKASLEAAIKEINKIAKRNNIVVHTGVLTPPNCDDDVFC